MVRCEAAQALGKLNDVKAMDPLLAALKDSAPPICQQAVIALSGFDEQRIGPALNLALLENPNSPQVRKSVIMALAKLESR